VYISYFTFAPSVARRISALGITEADIFDEQEVVIKQVVQGSDEQAN
jgi:hypothetical protein